MDINYNNVPLELKKLKQWVCVYSDSKIPMQATISKPADTTNPDTWTDFHTALSMVNLGIYSYLGFVFADDGIVGIDLDDIFQSDGKTFKPFAEDISKQLNTYAEYSKSGAGLHFFLKGDLPWIGKNNGQGVEIYKTERFFVMTGNVYKNEPILENQAKIDLLVSRYFEDREDQGVITPLDSQNRFNGFLCGPRWKAPEKGSHRIHIKPDFQKIKAGNRNQSLLSIGGQLISVGATNKDAYKLLSILNQKYCVPPLAQSEIQSICGRLYKYKRRR